MDPLTFLVLATLGAAFTRQEAGVQFQIPPWVHDQLWNAYISKWDEIPNYPTPQQLVMWDQMKESGKDPFDILPPNTNDLPIETLAEIVNEGDNVVYMMTSGDVAFVNWLRSRYMLGDVLASHMHELENPANPNETLNVLWLDHDAKSEISYTLWSEQTAESGNPIQRILFVIGPMEDEDAIEIQAYRDNEEHGPHPIDNIRTDILGLAGNSHSGEAGAQRVVSAIKSGMDWDDVLDLANEEFDAFGVESIEVDEDDYSSPPYASYLNTGDLYNETLVYLHGPRQWQVTTAGEVREAFENSEDELE